MYWVPGGGGGADEGSRPRSWRWVGVRGMSEMSSFGRKRGRREEMMLMRRKRRRKLRIVLG
jgi:hypothetical protein